MRKSDFLDQLRLEVGLVYDYAVSKEDFFRNVLYKIYELVGKKCVIAVYKPDIKGNYLMEFVIGKNKTEEVRPFGLGFIHFCSNQTSVVVKKRK
ncbi:MAG: hypothetical protein LRY73_04645 [Bacillus sp. (in: Bacteria)]|nr:hypothetical protein [Bacillus sp. (in: firmicutes)]